MNSEKLIWARDQLTESTPLKTDCGDYCENACCRPDEDGQGGVLLFPGEGALIEPCGWGRIVPGEGGYEFLFCDSPCDRKKRPLGCRIFPLTPVYIEEGKWSVSMDPRARAMCPLTTHGLRGLDRDFVNSAKRAIKILQSDPEYRDFLIRWSEDAQRFAQDAHL